jgi:hypothetical protein
MENSEQIDAPLTPRKFARWALRIMLPSLIAIVFLTSEEKLFSDAKAPHDTTAYDQLMAPPTRLSALGSLNLTNVVINRTNNKVRVTLPKIVAGKADFYDFTTVRVKPNEAAQLTEGELRIRYLGAAHGEVPQGDGNGMVEGQFHDLDGLPMSLNDVKEIHKSWRVERLSIQGQWPEIRMPIEAHPDEKLKFLSARVFDARTRRNLTSGHSSRNAKPNFKIYVFEMKRWHDAPIELIVDVAYGPVEIIQMATQSGTSTRVGHHTLHLLAAESGHANSSNMGGSGSSESCMSWTTQEESKDSEATFGFAVLPSANSFPAKIELFVKGKDKPQNLGCHTSATGLILSANSPLEDVQSIRITRYLNARRVISEIPNIPGLPSENDTIENLFDVHIPSARIKNASELERYIEDAVQLGFESRRLGRLTPPQGYFPRVFHDATPRELTLEYLKLSTNISRLRVNGDTRRIEVRGPWHEELFKKIRDGLKYYTAACHPSQSSPRTRPASPRRCHRLWRCGSIKLCRFLRSAERVLQVTQSVSEAHHAPFPRLRFGLYYSHYGPSSSHRICRWS